MQILGGLGLGGVGVATVIVGLYALEFRRFFLWMNCTSTIICGGFCHGTIVCGGLAQWYTAFAGCAACHN